MTTEKEKLLNFLDALPEDDKLIEELATFLWAAKDKDTIQAFSELLEIRQQKPRGDIANNRWIINRNGRAWSGDELLQRDDMIPAGARIEIHICVSQFFPS